MVEIETDLTHLRDEGVPVVRSHTRDGRPRKQTRFNTPQASVASVLMGTLSSRSRHATNRLLDAERMKSKSEPSSSQPGAATKSNVSRTSTFVQTVWDFIRPQPWVINNIRQRKSQKILFRSWLAGWAALIFMLPTRSLRTIGNLCVEFAFPVDNSLHLWC
jgi:hypothetical protein